jgi:transposase-like protein
MPLSYEFIVKTRAKYLKALNINPEEYETCLEIADKFDLRKEIVEKFLLKLFDKALKEFDKKQNNPNYTPKKLSASWTFIATLRKEISQKPKDTETLKKALHEAKKLYRTFYLQT